MLPVISSFYLSDHRRLYSLFLFACLQLAFLDASTERIHRIKPTRSIYRRSQHSKNSLPRESGSTLDKLLFHQRGDYIIVSFGLSKSQEWLKIDHKYLDIQKNHWSWQERRTWGLRRGNKMAAWRLIPLHYFPPPPSYQQMAPKDDFLQKKNWGEDKKFHIELPNSLFQ